MERLQRAGSRPSEPPPRGRAGALAWMRARLFDGALNSILTVVSALAIADLLEQAADDRPLAQPELGHYVVSGEQPRRPHYTLRFPQTHEQAVHIPRMS